MRFQVVGVISKVNDDVCTIEDSQHVVCRAEAKRIDYVFLLDLALTVVAGFSLVGLGESVTAPIHTLTTVTIKTDLKY